MIEAGELSREEADMEHWHMVWRSMPNHTAFCTPEKGGEALIEIDRGHHIKIHSPVCGPCRHWSVLEGRTCAAFPETDSIPLEIWQGKNDHTGPYPGDHGIRFEPMGPEDRTRRKKELEKALARAKAADEELMSSILE